MTTTLATTIYRVTRANNTINGNPMYVFHTAHGTIKTSNVMANYTMTNNFQIDSSLNNGDGIDVILTLTKAGRAKNWTITNH